MRHPTSQPTCTAPSRRLGIRPPGNIRIRVGSPTNAVRPCCMPSHKRSTPQPNISISGSRCRFSLGLIHGGGLHCRWEDIPAAESKALDCGAPIRMGQAASCMHLACRVARSTMPRKLAHPLIRQAASATAPPSAPQPQPIDRHAREDGGPLARRGLRPGHQGLRRSGLARQARAIATGRRRVDGAGRRS